MEKEVIIKKIEKLKREKDALILVHNYQRAEVQDVADFIGDSLELSRKAQSISCRIIVFCGVRFMGETAKILSPDKVVLLPREEAGCPMADMVTPDNVIELRKRYPQAQVISYVNTTAQVKAESDACCTSANAVKVVQNMDAESIIFLPDRNLARFTMGKVTNKHIIPYQGYCYVHERITPEDIIEAKRLHPEAKVIVHPECRPEVVRLADEALSTGGMVKFARESTAKEVIVGTEEGILHRLRKENPEKRFFATAPELICRDMKLTTLRDLYLSLKHERYPIIVEDGVRKRAKKALDKMLQCVG